MKDKCFAYDSENGCRVLTHKKCPRGCAFYKTQSQVDVEEVIANQRLASLREDRQWYIAESYYSGKRPWLKWRLV